MKEESIETVLNEVCEEVRSLKQLCEAQNTQLEKFGNQVNVFDEKLSEMKAIPLSTDLSSVEEKINTGIKRLQIVLENYPKKINREFHLHLFPKMNIMDYYKTYSKLILYLTLLAIIAGLFGIGTKWIEGYNERQQLIQIHSFESNSNPVQPIEKTKKRINK